MQTGNEGNEQAFEFGLRPGEPADLDFIVDSWRRSYDDAPNTRCPGGLPEYIATQRQVIEQCLKTSSVLVAYPRAPDNVPGQILGWVCFRKVDILSVVHYVYVKPVCRRAGIGRSLVSTAAPRQERGSLVNAVFHTHLFPASASRDSDPAAQFARRMTWDRSMQPKYNPALIFAPPPGTIVEVT